MLFPEHFSCKLSFYESENFSGSSLHQNLNPKILGFLFLRKNSLTWVNEWNSHLEILSRSQAIEKSRPYLLLRTDSLQKTVVSCPCLGAIVVFSVRPSAKIMISQLFFL